MDAPPARFWIFQALPERYDLAKRLSAGRVENWVVSSFGDAIARGDVVYMWQAGTEAALHGWATVKRPRRLNIRGVPVSFSGEPTAMASGCAA